MHIKITVMLMTMKIMEVLDHFLSCLSRLPFTLPGAISSNFLFNINSEWKKSSLSWRSVERAEEINDTILYPDEIINR